MLGVCPVGTWLCAENWLLLIRQHGSPVPGLLVSRPAHLSSINSSSTAVLDPCSSAPCHSSHSIGGGSGSAVLRVVWEFALFRLCQQILLVRQLTGISPAHFPSILKLSKSAFLPASSSNYGK